MKKRKLTYAAAALALAAALLLTGCSGTAGGTTGGNQYPNHNTTTGGTTGGGTNNKTDNDGHDKTDTDDNNKNNTNTGSVFENALNKAYNLPESYDGWHLIVDDYDGDGRQEAFAFAGIPRGSYWDNLSTFYIDPNGKITELKLNSHLAGGPQGTESTSNRNYSKCSFKYKQEKFVVFYFFPSNVDGDAMLSAVYGVHNGSVTQKEINDGGSVQKTPEGFIYASGLDEDFAYVVKNGRLVDMRTTSDAYKYVDPDYSARTVAVKTAWKNYTEHVQIGNKEYFLQYDFDGDGRQEAYVFAGLFQDGYYTSSAEIYYIGWGGTVLRVGYGEGQLYQCRNFGYTTDDSVIKAGNQRFVLWQIPGAGHAATRVFGARNGVPYEPQISGQLSYFHQSEDGRFYAESGQKYVDDEYLFNSATGEFYKR